MADRDTTVSGEAQPASLLRVDDVLTRLAISRRTLYRLIAAGRLIPIYLDRRPRFDAADVAALIENARSRNDLARRCDISELMTNQNPLAGIGPPEGSGGGEADAWPAE
jgi:predicted DNA-binding transcriptional regulator AlpA